jgi:predicted DNA-binding transcriptional regulator AlpA
MKFSNQIAFRDVSTITNLSRQSINRLIEAGEFPEPTIMGKSYTWQTKRVYQAISEWAGKPVDTGDLALTTRQVQIELDRSHTWLWRAEKEKIIPRSFKVLGRKFWLLSDINKVKNPEQEEAE